MHRLLACAVLAAATFLPSQAQANDCRHLLWSPILTTCSTPGDCNGQVNVCPNAGTCRGVVNVCVPGS